MKKQYRILIADDDFVSLKAAQKILEKRGYNTSTARSGKEVLDRIADDQFDLILMDIKMPGMNGMDATKQIRGKKSELKNIPIVAMTAYAMYGDKERLLQAGIDDYIAKPLEKEDLIEVVERNVKELVQLPDNQGLAI